MDELERVALDVARSLVAYGRYGGARTGALRALKKRAPGHAADDYERMLGLLCEVIAEARASVPRHVRRPEDASGFAAFEDVDLEACLLDVDRHAPGVALEAKRAAVSWAIMHDYLK